jgi:hypothetical protein
MRMHNIVTASNMSIRVCVAHLDQLALCCLESDNGHLAGQRVDLLNQEGQPGSTGLPVFQLVLLKIDR